MSPVGLQTIKHLQGVFSFVVVCGVEDVDPDHLCAALSVSPHLLVNLLLPAGGERGGGTQSPLN